MAERMTVRSAPPRHGGRRPTIHAFVSDDRRKSWMPACAGMTGLEMPVGHCFRQFELQNAGLADGKRARRQCHVQPVQIARRQFRQILHGFQEAI